MHFGSQKFFAMSLVILGFSNCAQKKIENGITPKNVHSLSKNNPSHLGKNRAGKAKDVTKESSPSPKMDSSIQDKKIEKDSTHVKQQTLPLLPQSTQIIEKSAGKSTSGNIKSSKEKHSKSSEKQRLDSQENTEAKPSLADQAPDKIMEAKISHKKNSLEKEKSNRLKTKDRVGSKAGETIIGKIKKDAAPQKASAMEVQQEVLDARSEAASSRLQTEPLIGLLPTSSAASMLPKNTVSENRGKGLKLLNPQAKLKKNLSTAKETSLLPIQDLEPGGVAIDNVGKEETSLLKLGKTDPFQPSQQRKPTWVLRDQEQQDPNKKSQNLEIGWKQERLRPEKDWASVPEGLDFKGDGSSHQYDALRRFLRSRDRNEAEKEGFVEPKSLEHLKTWNQGRGGEFKGEENQVEEKRFQEALRWIQQKGK